MITLVGRMISMALVGGCTIFCVSAVAENETERQITDSVLQETRDIISRELYGHYDVTSLTVLDIVALPDRLHLGQDYGLVKVALAFSTKRNTTRSPNLNPDMFTPGSPMCQGWLYLHCGVPAGHVFDGRLQVMLAADRRGAWRAASPHWRSRTEYSLHGYLLLDGRDKEGYVLFPRRP